MSFALYAVWFAMKKLFMSLPGPVWVKAILIVLCIAIPGPLDEIVLVALPVVCRKLRARRAGRSARINAAA